ncbi:MAG: hypothetical protein SCH98_09960 [Deferrisomatales bacterium]|nr:hypothetical protein [Deferrisomatales bacterium]
MWSDEAHRLALLELWATGCLKRRKNQGDAWYELSELPWTRRTSRRDELALDEGHRRDLERLLDRSWPDWRDLLTELERHDLSLDLHGWKTLQQRRRADGLPEILPDRLNQRTATAALGSHSKATLGERLRQALGPLEVTRDGLIRIRPNEGLLVERGSETWSATMLAGFLGELALTERALRDGTTLGGTLPTALLLVENVGFYIDVPAPPRWMVAHVPGWNTATTRLLFDALPTVPVVHFGDLDPNGVRIVAHLQLLRPDLLWAVPDFWEEQISLRGLRCDWPSDLDLTAAPALVQRLAREGMWLEQEALALDPRLTGYLKEILSS